MHLITVCSNYAHSHLIESPMTNARTNSKKAWDRPNDILGEENLGLLLLLFYVQIFLAICLFCSQILAKEDGLSKIFHLEKEKKVSFIPVRFLHVPDLAGLSLPKSISWVMQSKSLLCHFFVDQCQPGILHSCGIH